MSKSRVLIVSPDISFRRELRNLLEKNITVEIVSEAADGNDAINLAKTIQPDIFCMNINLTNIDDFKTIQKIKLLLPNAEILIIAEHIDEFIVTDILNAGVKGYISKDASIEEIEKAFEKVQAHQIYMENSLDNKKKIFDQLTSREISIAKLISQGKRTTDIALLQDLSPKTVNAFRHRIFQKLGIKSDVELVNIVRKIGEK